MDLSLIKDIAYIILFGISLYTFYKSRSDEKAVPINELKSELAVLKERVAEHEKKLANDNDRFESIDESNRIMLTSILALLSHGIDGNEIDGMKKAKSELEAYLIRK